MQAPLVPLFGDSLVAEATNLIHDLTLVKSATELNYIREAARIADVVMTRFVAALVAGRSEFEIASEVYHALLTSGSGLAASPINLVAGNSEYTLQSGVVVTVEPSVFLNGERVGARIIDNVLVMNDGAELLSPFSRDLIVIE